MSKILILQGHPDTSHPHLCHALADAYAAGAQQAGHGVRRVDIGALDFPLLRSKSDWNDGDLPTCLAQAQAQAQAQANIGWCDHLVLVFPLWLGGLPKKLTAFWPRRL